MSDTPRSATARAPCPGSERVGSEPTAIDSSESLAVEKPPTLGPGVHPLAQLSPAADALARARPGSVTEPVRDLATGATYSYEPDARHVLASLTKVPIALAALEQQCANGPFDWETQYWLREMIINSDNWGTLMVLDAIGGEPAFVDYLQSVGLPDLARFYFLPDWGESVGSVADVLDLFAM